MYDSRMFCDDDESWNGPITDYIQQRWWHHDPEDIKTATCSVCLQRIIELGAWANTVKQRLQKKTPEPIKDPGFCECKFCTDRKGGLGCCVKEAAKLAFS